MSTRSNCCIIGIPDHQGVINVGGRIGAWKGPQAFRRLFSKFRDRKTIGKQIRDCGDVPDVSSDIASNLKNAADFVSKCQKANDFSVVVGGGHDHGFSHLQGVSEAFRSRKTKLRLGCINLDAHLDVREPQPIITSGSPFYLALESGLLSPKRFVEFGIQSHCNGPELWSYVEKKGVKVIPFQQLRQGKAVRSFSQALKKLAATSDLVVVSLDLDSAASCFAPGVSAPQAEGFSASEIIEMMEIAGLEKRVVSLGIFELNPEHDRDDCTARLAATAAFHFIQSRLSGKK